MMQSPISRVLLSVTISLSLLSVSNADPAWWSTGVIGGGTPADYSLVNQGQAKQVAAKARIEFDLRLPGGAGPRITALVDSWAVASSMRDDFLVLNRGQIKNLAKLFYDRLAEVGYGGNTLAAGQRYPWGGGGTADDFAYANIGELKLLFSFDLVADSDGDELPDWWEKGHGLDDLDPNDAGLDSDGDGATNLKEYFAGRDPHQADTELGGALVVANVTNLQVYAESNTPTARQLTVTNTGLTSQTFTIDTSDANISVNPYEVSDSNSGGGPTFVWNDIGITGTRLNAASSSRGSSEAVADIGFAFPFYGAAFSSLRVFSSGYVSFDSSTTVFLNDFVLPNTSSPRSAIGPALFTGLTWEVRYLKELGKITFQWNFGVWYDPNYFLKLQAVLEQSGDITFFYGSGQASATSYSNGLWNGGIQNASGDDGVQVVRNLVYLQPARAVRLRYRPTWLVATPASITLPAGARQTIALNYIPGQSNSTSTAQVRFKDSVGASVGLPFTTTLVVSDDFDGDGVSNQKEYPAHGDPFTVDNNGDGITDSGNIAMGRDPSLWDTDGDGISNMMELQLGTDPYSADTDGDGVPDGSDAFPLDPSRSQLSVSNPVDHTAPVVTLLKPTGAVLLP